MHDSVMHLPSRHSTYLREDVGQDHSERANSMPSFILLLLAPLCVHLDI